MLKMKVHFVIVNLFTMLFFDKILSLCSKFSFEPEFKWTLVNCINLVSSLMMCCQIRVLK
jgi:hypothetical protein